MHCEAFGRIFHMRGKVSHGAILWSRHSSDLTDLEYLRRRRGDDKGQISENDQQCAAFESYPPPRRPLSTRGCFPDLCCAPRFRNVRVIECMVGFLR